MINMILNDDELKKVVGGQDFQFNEKNEVYLVFPSQVAFLNLDGWYSVKKLEDLAKNFAMFANKIKPYITDDMRNACIELYKRNGMTTSQIPSNVKNIMGIQ